MANRFDVKAKTFFQISPKNKQGPVFYDTANRVMFMGQCFDLDDISLITECVQVGELWYQFKVHTGYANSRVLEFDFKRKQDCLAAQEELARAWTRTGEFVYEDENLDAGESSDT